MSERIGIVDTTVVIHLYRKNPAAIAWLNAQQSAHKITPYTWLEVVYGAPNKRTQAVCIALMENFEMVFP